MSSNTTPDSGLTALFLGAGIYVAGSNCVVTNCTIVHNIPGKRPSYLNGLDSYASGVYITNGLVTDSLITNNLGFGKGAGIGMQGGTVQRCQIVGNLVGYLVTYGANNAGGAGVYIEGGLLDRCLILNNTDSSTNDTPGSMTRGGGGIRSAGGIVRNCLIANNTATNGANGGGIWISGGTGIVDNCTIISNTITSTTGTGGGIYRQAGAVTNTIIVQNTTQGSANNAAATNSDFTSFGYSCAPELPNSVNGNITAAPRFKDVGFGGYTLAPNSPGFNAGFNESWMATGRDLAGNARIVLGTVDMGAYETPLPQGTMFFIQ